VGIVRAIAAGDSLPPESAAPDAFYFVVEGPLELRATASGVRVTLGLVGKGECVDPGPYALVACEAASVIEISPVAFEVLPPSTQRTLSRIAISSCARRYQALAARHSVVRDRNAQLVAAVKQLAGRPDPLLAVPQVRDALAKIPALPVQALGLATKLLDDRTHTEEVVESIKNDPALASLVLKRVNAAYYGLETKVSDHYRALLLLGTAAVYQLILESAIETVIPDVPETREIQTRATLISVLAYEIALASGQGNPLVASTVGLLHNIGDSIAQLLRRTRPEVAGLVECVESPALGAAVLAGWGLPSRVYEVVQRQELPESVLPEELDVHGAELSVLYVAKVCHDVLVDRTAPPAHVGAYLTRLGLRETNAATFCREVLVPALAKKAESLPAAVRARLNETAASPRG
jgi:HD-like signal output (HDOD) protein